MMPDGKVKIEPDLNRGTVRFVDIGRSSSSDANIGSHCPSQSSQLRRNPNRSQSRRMTRRRAMTRAMTLAKKTRRIQLRSRRHRRPKNLHPLLLFCRRLRQCRLRLSPRFLPERDIHRRLLPPRSHHHHLFPRSRSRNNLRHPKEKIQNPSRSPHSQPRRKKIRGSRLHQSQISDRKSVV